jgi:RNA recognition motif-containing protein
MLILLILLLRTIENFPFFLFYLQLDYKVDAKKLKQVFKLAGKVVSLELSLDKEGNSRGFAVVEFDHPVEAVQAISLFDRQVLFDRRMTVRLDRVPDKSEGYKLPDGLKGIGIGLGPNGEPLRDVARNLPSLQQNNQSQQSQQNNMNNMNNLGNAAPTPVAAPSSILGPVPNANNLGTLGSNLAALSNVVGLSSLGGLSNPLLSTAAASLSSLGLAGLGGSNDQNNSNQYNPSAANNYNTGYNTGSGRSDFDLGGGGGGGQNQQVRNYNTQQNQNDDFSRNFGNMGNNNSNLGRQQNSDTIVIRNVSKI